MSAELLNIGQMLDELREEFPELTISKIRYLEDQRLITPKRTAGGYRLYSPLEVERLRREAPRELICVTPGIRPVENRLEADQKRIMTPAAAIKAGADYIVVGRPITSAANRRDAALRIVDEMERAG